MPTGTDSAHQIRFDRRRVLQCTLAWGLGAMGPQLAGAGSPPAQLLVSWYRGDQAWVGRWQDGHTVTRTPLPARAHQLLALPPPRLGGRPVALAVARRPGEYLLRWDPHTGRALQLHPLEDDRALAGHAVYAPALDTLFTTETDVANGQGLVVGRDPLSLQRRFEWASGGIGPHALLWEAHTASPPTLLVANGGLLNLPESGRRKLNLGRMDSNLTRLDAHTGTVLCQWRLDDPHLSLRHLAQAADGTVGIALQAEHPERALRAHAPALALLDAQGLHAVPAPSAEIAPHWDGYAGDIACTENTFWVTAPQAGLLMAWQSPRSAAQAWALEGICPVAALDTQIVALGLRGYLRGTHTVPAPRTPWDNHALRWI